MTRRDEILEYAQQHGWDESDDPFGSSAWNLMLVRQPTPDAPLGGPRFKVWIQFATDVGQGRVQYADVGIGRADRPLLGGIPAIKRHLRENGSKA